MNAETLNLGKIITEHQERDAVHIAVAPVVAYRGVMPGTAVGFIEGSTTEVDALSENLIGIVDPYLTKMVKRGESFWLFLYPGSITSLRHDWTHPAFEAYPARLVTTGLSEQWLRAYGVTIDTSYETLMNVAENWVKYGEYAIQGGRWEGVSIPDDFWMHYEAVTGTKVPESKQQHFFSCSC